MKKINLGILQVNHDKSEDIGDKFPDDAHRFRNLFDDLETRFKYKVYMTIGDELPKDINEQDAYLITGSPLSVRDDHSFSKKLYEFKNLFFDEELVQKEINEIKTIKITTDQIIINQLRLTDK